MKFLKLFFIQRHREILAFALLAVVLGTVWVLYRFPLAALWYILALDGTIGLVFLTVDYLLTKQQHKKLQGLQHSPDTVTQMLPTAATVAEADYQDILRVLTAENADRAEKWLRQQEERMEYYTVWVHQIKTPIASMQLALQNEDSALSRRLGAELSRIDQYVEMVMTYLRLDAESGDYILRSVSLDTVVRAAVRRFSGEFIGRKLSLSYQPLQTCVVTDEKWLRFVLEQLLSNALKYTPSGGITIEMAHAHTLCIKDTGIGIAAADLPRIFEKGYTGYTGHESRQSSGIGLYLCRRICQNLGIGLTIQSTVGEGTCVQLDFSQYTARKE